MSRLLVAAANLLIKREQPRLVAATGLLFAQLSESVESQPIVKILESYRNGVWGAEAAVECGYPVLRSTNTRGTRVDVTAPAWCDVPPDQAESFALATGDILVTKSSGSSDLVGKAALFTHPGDGRKYLFSNFTMRLRPNQRLILPEFLAWFLRSPQSLAWRYETQQNAVGLRNLQTREFLDQSLPIPDRETQAALVAYLDALEEDPHIANSMQLPPLLIEQQRIVTRIEALAARIEEARGLRGEAIQEIGALVVATHLNLAEGRTVKLSEILTLDENREEVQFGRSYPQVGVRGFGQGLFARETLEATETTYKAFNRLYEGAVVLSQVKGWEGAVGVCGANLAGLYVSPEYRTFRCFPGKATPRYLAAVIATPWFWKQLKDITRGLGGRRERTRPEQFLQLEIPMPDIHKQERAVRVFDKLENLKAQQASTVAELDALLPAVLDRAFKGEL